MRHVFRFRVLLFYGALVAAPASAVAQEGESAVVAVPLERWLALGPVPFPLPAFHGAEEKGYGLADLLGHDLVDPALLAPADGETLRLPDGREARWRATDASGGELALAGEAPPAGEEADATAKGPPLLALAVTYLDARRFEKCRLAVEGPAAACLRVLLDGREVARSAGMKTKTGKDGKEDESANEEDDEDGDEEGDEDGDDAAPKPLSAELVLAPGRHVLLLQAARAAGGESPWTATARLERSEPFTAAPLSGTTDPRRYLTVGDHLGGTAIASVQLSADGSLAAIRYRYPDSAEKRDDWLELRRFADGALVQTFRGDTVYTDFAWAPRGRRFSSVTRDGERSTLWVNDLDAGTSRPVLERFEHLGAHAWSPDGESIVYVVKTPAEKSDNEKAGVTRLRGLTDRWREWRDRSHLWQIDLRDGSRRRLTAGALTTALEDIRRDGGRLLFSTRVYHHESRPYSTTALHELDLATLEARELASGPWIGGASYSPDGRRALVLAGPSAFGDVGQAVGEGGVPNDYDGQAYVLDLETREVAALSRDFDPGITNGVWARDGRVYVLGRDGDLARIFRRDPAAGSWEALPAAVEVIDGMSIALDAPRLVYHGTSATAPARAYALDLAASSSGPDAGAGDASRLLAFPDRERFERIAIGEVRPWSFTLEDGTEIAGRVHLPPDLDESRRYPCIVYYYGGTWPTDRSFGGRYPKDLWAARGYVVYVLQPSGAVGFGQEFSARHVNNWGRTVVGEIVEGVEKFLAAHPFVDPERVGCIGASYGGFMTMLLLTHTDRFAAAVSHAGISSIASYWGEGWWGYLYSAVATAESFPWNRKDLYVEQSALFHADRITTPLLLLHGTADTNVPPGESEQMYTALRVLGKEVEYVRFEGEDHWILAPEKRRIWVETILAWFDRWLKGEPEHWEHLHGGE